MYTPMDIGTKGEHIVSHWLTEKGYRTHLIAKGPDVTGIEAQGHVGKLLIQVRSAVLPDLPKSLSNYDEHRVKSQASELGYIPWEAKVQLDDDLRIIGKIKWRKLV
jgi:hypothetical protein